MSSDGLMKLRTAVLASALLAVSASTGAQSADGPTDVADFLKETDHLERAFVRLTARNGRTLRALEQVRTRCREQEREMTTGEPPDEQPAWLNEWEATEPSRLALQQQVQRVAQPWYDKLEAVIQTNAASPIRDEERRMVAGACLRVAHAGVRLGEPVWVLEELPDELGALATTLGWGTGKTQRRSFLATVADRLAATPGMSDLDLLCEIVGWEELLLAGETSIEERVQMLTGDLVLVFTERSGNGISLSDAGFYRAGRCDDTGFHETLRDGSDQVRHLCWAMRMFAIAPDAVQMEQVLRLREVRDARVRGEPVNEADIKLNRAARELVEELRSVERETADAVALSNLFRTKVGD